MGAVHNCFTFDQISALTYEWTILENKRKRLEAEKKAAEEGLVLVVSLTAYVLTLEAKRKRSEAEKRRRKKVNIVTI